jgi:hypothetical protein
MPLAVHDMLLCVQARSYIHRGLSQHLALWGHAQPGLLVLHELQAVCQSFGSRVEWKTEHAIVSATRDKTWMKLFVRWLDVVVAVS